MASPYPKGRTSRRPRTNGSVKVSAPNERAGRRLRSNSLETELEAGDEHQVEEAERAERLDDPLPGDPVEDERAEEHPRG